MPLVPITLQPGLTASRLKNQSAATLVNMYAEQSSGKGAFPVIGYPGRPRRKIMAPPIRGMIVHPQGRFYVIDGGSFHEIGADFQDLADLGAIAGTGLVETIANRTQVAVIADGRLYVHTVGSSVISQVTATEYGSPLPAFYSAAVVDNIAVLTVRDSDRFYYSATDDFTTIRDLAFATAESKADPLLVVRDVGGELFFGGARSTEHWVKTGQANFPFQRRDPVSSYTVVSRDACRRSGDDLLWLGEDADNGGLGVFALNGYQAQRISTPAVDRILEAAQYPERARCVVWRLEGHAFCEFSLDSGSVVYDTATGEWHQSAYGVWTYESLKPPASRLTCQAWWQGQNVLGTADGLLLGVSFDTSADGDDLMARVFVTPALGAFGQQVSTYQVGVDIEAGLGPLDDDPLMWMRWSHDGAHTWGRPQFATMGRQGQYLKRPQWGPQGQANDSAAMFGTTANCQLRVTNAWARVVPAAIA